MAATATGEKAPVANRRAPRWPSGPSATGWAALEIRETVMSTFCLQLCELQDAILTWESSYTRKQENLLADVPPEAEFLCRLASDFREITRRAVPLSYHVICALRGSR